MTFMSTTMPLWLYFLIGAAVGTLMYLSRTFELAFRGGIALLMVGMTVELFYHPRPPSWESVSDWFASWATDAQHFWIGFGLGGAMLIAVAFLRWFVPWNERRA